MTKKAITLTLVALSLNLAPLSGQDFASLRRNAAEGDVPFPPASVTLGGIMVSNDNWTGDGASGIYTLEARPGGKVKLMHRIASMANTAASLYRGNVMYVVEASMNDGYHYLSYSTNSWSAGTREEIDVVNVPSDLTFDEVTGMAYGGFWDEDYGGYSRFASFGLATAEATDIDNPTRDERDIFAIAADGKGTVYGLFGSFNYLATFDTRTGAATRIGRTGLTPVASTATGRASSMVYDAVNDRLLAAVYQEDGYGANKQCLSALYEIDIHTGAATELYKLDGNASIAGLYIADDRPATSAPAAARNLAVAFTAPTEGSVEFDAPALSVGGSSLTGTIMAQVSVGGSSTVVRGIVPGSHVSVPGLPFVNGDNTVKVIMADAENRGEAVELTLWAGEDVPSEVTELALTVADGAAHLSWTAPALGANGGALVEANLRYTVTRYPDRKVVAQNHASTQFTDTEIDPAWKALYYEVSCSNSVGTSAPVSSNRCPAAGALALPFTETFDTADDFDCWTVLDGNGGTSWAYDKSGKRARYEYHHDNIAADDWLVTPPLSLVAGQLYKVSYGYRAYNKSYPESFELMLGAAPTVEAMDVLLASHVNFNNTAEQTGTRSFTVDADGRYYLGFHCISEPKMWYLYLDNITVEAIDSRVPAAVSELNLVPGERGALSARVEFTAPVKDADGGSLGALTKAIVYRSDLTGPVKTIENLTPGSKQLVDDTDIPQAGIYTYTVVCVNEVGESLPAEVRAYIGVDAPGAVGELAIGDDGTHPVLSWTAPVLGANGGWFDADAVSYRIVRSDGELVVENLTALSYTDASYTLPASTQEPLWYLVTPYVGSLKGAYAQTSDVYLAGKPYATPATETFAAADMAYYPWMAKSANAVRQSWTLDTSGYNPTTADQSGDRGLATFHSVGEPAGTVSDFYSPKFSLAGLANPTLSFHLYHSPSIEGDASMEVLVSTGGDFSHFVGPIARTAAEADGWQRYTVSLAAYADAPYVRFAFRGTGDGVADIYLDNVAVVDAVACDLALTSFAAPARVAAGESVDYDLRVYNAGTEAAAAAKVSVSDAADGSILGQTVLESIAAGAELTVTIPLALRGEGIHSLTASVSIEGDAVAANNSASALVEAVKPVVPAPVNLTVSATDDGAFLRWDAPSEQGAVCDDVESYTPWAIDGVGQWTMHDGDYDLTYYINTGVDYANASARKAFQVLDVKKLGIDIWDEGKAHSGNRLFAALASMNYVNDDWLISPRLNGSAQWISFYARSFTTQDTPMERMRVHYSSSDTDPANFTSIGDGYVELDGVWRLYRYFVPEGSRYFAVNCVSDGAFAMFVDDLCFNDLTVPAWEISGYEVLRDGVPVGTATDCAFTDADATDGAAYTVRALYGLKGAGPESEAVKYDVSGIGSVATELCPVAIYTADGLPAASMDRPGIYMVRYSDGSVRKVVR
ncbi:MAG: choice-of-anchor J domain-containing protein [Muribaculaceae bacterium]|nr:choice-of-anchor J domain-containing protein [Muribaculaceae bacterium]